MTEHSYNRDVRVRRTATTARAARLPSGRIARPGSLVVPINVVRVRKGETISHRDFNPVAIALDVAMTAAEQADVSRSLIKYDAKRMGAATDRMVTLDSTEALLTYVQQGMVAVTFSVQALEMFCNDVIDRQVTECYQWPPQAVGSSRCLTAASLQRQASLTDKLADIVPALLGIRAPEKGVRLWSDFQRLIKLRNRVVHPKGHDQRFSRSSGRRIDDSSMWHAMLNSDVPTMPRTTVSMLHFLTHGDQVPDWTRRPDWLEPALGSYGIR